MHYYISSLTNKIVTDKDLKVVEYICGDISIAKQYLNEYPEDTPPSVIEILKHDSWPAAITRYMELHPNADYNSACRAVAIMKKDIARFGKKEE